jgi:predicted nucleic acid-binding protein
VPSTYDRFLLDTNILSEFNRRGDPNPQVKQWLEAAEPTSLYVSVLTLAEIRFGVELLPTSKRRTQLEEWLDGELFTWFENRILPIGSRIADRWAVLRAQAQMKGRPLSVVDGLLAATALEHDLMIVSRNVGDFEATGLVVLNPWNI